MNVEVHLCDVFLTLIVLLSGDHVKKLRLVAATGNVAKVRYQVGDTGWAAIEETRRHIDALVHGDELRCIAAYVVALCGEMWTPFF